MKINHTMTPQNKWLGELGYLSKRKGIGKIVSEIDEIENKYTMNMRKCTKGWKSKELFFFQRIIVKLEQDQQHSKERGKNKNCHDKEWKMGHYCRSTDIKIIQWATLCQIIWHFVWIGQIPWRNTIFNLTQKNKNAE